MASKKDNFKLFIETLTQFDKTDDPIFGVQPTHDWDKGQRRFARFYNFSDLLNVYGELSIQNSRGWGLHAPINQMGPDENGNVVTTEKGHMARKNVNCLRVRSFAIDFDYYLPLSFIKQLRDYLSPTMIVLSSKDDKDDLYKSHFYFLCEDKGNKDWNELNKSRFKQYQKGLAYKLEEYTVSELGLPEGTIVTDKGIADLARVLRIPGFMHQKNRDNPFEVKLAWLSEDYLTEENFIPKMESLGITEDYIRTLKGTSKALPTLDEEGEFFTPDPEARNQSLFYHACTLFREGRHYDEVCYTITGLRDDHYSSHMGGKDPISDEELDTLIESAHNRHLEFKASRAKQGAKSGDKFKAADFLKQQVKELNLTTESDTFKYDFSNSLVYGDPTSFRSIMDRFHQRFGHCYRMLEDSLLKYQEGQGTWTKDSNTLLDSYYTVIDDMKKEPAVRNMLVTKQGEIDQLRFYNFFNRLQGNKKFLEFKGELNSSNVFLAQPEDFDKHKHLLNCKDCVVDLKNKKVLPHSSDLLMTQQTNSSLLNGFDYIHNYKDMDTEAWTSSNIWTKFIWQCVSKDLEMANYLQRCLGYLLETGNAEQVLLFFYGTGSNGKSLTLEVIKRALGDYVGTLRSDIWNTNSNTSDVTLLSELNLAWNKRAVITSECPKNMALNEELVKKLTGETTIEVKKYHADIQHEETKFKPIIMSNYSLNINSSTDGIWRRVVLIPYLNYVGPKDVDPELLDKLSTESVQSKVLAWLIAGNQMYREQGLNPPKSIISMQRSYRLNSLPMREFLDEAMDVNDRDNKDWLDVPTIIQLHNRFKSSFAGGGKSFATCDPQAAIDILKSMDVENDQIKGVLGNKAVNYNLKLKDEYKSLVEASTASNLISIKTKVS